MKRLLTAVATVCVLFMSCGSPSHVDATPHEKAAIQIVHKTTKQLKTKIPGLHLSDEVTLIHDGQVVALTLDASKNTNDLSARALILKISNAYMEAFNSNSKYREYIHDPYTIKNFEISLHCSKDDRNAVFPIKVLPVKISDIKLSDGIIRYFPDPKHPVEQKLEAWVYRLYNPGETYEEAMRKSDYYYQAKSKILSETAQKLKTKIPGLHLSGFGGQINGGQEISMSFDIPQEIDEGSGRDLILKISKAYLDAYNSSQEFRPFIREYPFTIKNLHITLFFSMPDRTKIPTGKINIISISRGIVQYDAHNPNEPLPLRDEKRDQEYRLMTVHEETYEDALK